MTILREFDPESDYIVVRSKKTGGTHAHVSLKDLDRLFEGIGASARQAPTISENTLAEINSANEASLKAIVDIIDKLERQMSDLSERLGILESGILALSADARRKLMENAA